MTKPPATPLRWALVLAVLAAACERRQEAPAARAVPEVVVTPSGIEMVRLPGGWLEMGSADGEPDEQPVHRVWIDPFLIDRTELTQEQFARFKETLGDPSHFKGAARPVEMVSWSDAAWYCNLRSEAEGLQPCYDDDLRCDFEADGYRLPTEAEWEYACRAGARTPYSFGRDPRQLNAHAWFADNAGKQTHPVGQKRPNPWGLFDLHGNVAEWCNDLYAKDYYARSPQREPRGPAVGERYVLRGGAWNSSASACRSAARVGEAPGIQDPCFARDAIGFRCVRRLAAAAEPGTGGDAPPPRTAFLYGEIYLRHKTGPGHPERPERLTAIVRRLKEKGLLGQMLSVKPTPAALEWLTSVHTPQYVERVRASCREDLGYVDTRDAPACRESYDAALAAVGGVLAAIDAVVEGKARYAFCAVRPPGHHALPDRAMGFCFFNNVAIAARYIQKKHKLARVLIVDWDVHHGNGTQATFYDDPTVFYFGIHQSPFYPGTGSADEKGAGKGLGTTLNVPLPAGSGDADFRKAFEERLRPAALAFKPDFVLISAGFDAHTDDLLGGMEVTAEGFAELTRIVRAIAETCCRGRLVSVLEGGYHLGGLADSVEAHVRVLME